MKKLIRLMMALPLSLLFALNAEAATLDVVLDLERGYNSGAMEGHVGSDGTGGILFNDVNTLPATGQNLSFSTVISPTSPTSISLELSAFSDDGSDLFVNTILSNDVVQFGGEFGLGGSYALDSYSVEIVKGGVVSSISEINVLYLEGDGSAANPFGIELQFDGLDFAGASEVSLYANFSAVPVPAAVWLFGSALAGLGWMRRKPVA